MKKKFYLLLVFTMGMFLVACQENPYSGRYEAKDNTILKLKSDNNCTIIINLYRNAFYVDGKYTIEDNNININFNDKKANYFETSTLKGKVEGGRIKLYNSAEKEYMVYYKK